MSFSVGPFKHYVKGSPNYLRTTFLENIKLFFKVSKRTDKIIRSACCSICIRVSKGRDVPGQTGTGRPVVPLSRDKKVLPVPLSLCPGTKNISCPGVPLSWDKGRSKCTGTNSSVPGRPGTK